MKRHFSSVIALVRCFFWLLPGRLSRSTTVLSRCGAGTTTAGELMQGKRAARSGSGRLNRLSGKTGASGKEP